MPTACSSETLQFELCGEKLPSTGFWLTNGNRTLLCPSVFRKRFGPALDFPVGVVSGDHLVGVAVEGVNIQRNAVVKQPVTGAQDGSRCRRGSTRTRHGAPREKPRRPAAIPCALRDPARLAEKSASGPARKSSFPRPRYRSRASERGNAMCLIRSPAVLRMSTGKSVTSPVSPLAAA